MHDFRPHKVAVALVSLMLLFCATYALAQGIVTGSLSGTAVDPQGAVIPGAKVTARNTATNLEFTDVTSPTGAFQLRALPPGTYVVTLEAPNFEKVSVKDVVVRVGVDSGLGAVTLPIGKVTETVTVESSVPLVEVATSQLSTTFENKQATDLPIGTAFDNLALLVPGAADAGDAAYSNSNGTSISMNGQRGRSNNFQIDGQANNDNSVAGPSLFFGNQDTIAEVQIVSNNFSAEYGRNMGSVVNYVTKSGGNTFHGSLFEFFTGNYSFSRTNDEKSPVFGYCPSLSGGSCNPSVVPKFVENRFGGTVGGPIRKDKMWFFAALMKDEIASNNIVTSGSASTPTPQGLLMLENQYCGVAFTVFTPTPCPTHPALGALLNAGPYANPNGNPTPGAVQLRSVTDDGGATFLDNVPFASVGRSVRSPSTDWQVMGRIDWQITSKDRFFGRYNLQDDYFMGYTGRFAAGAWVDLPARTQQIAVDWVRNFTDHFINQVRFSYSRAYIAFEGQSGSPNGWKDCLTSSPNNCKTGVTMYDDTMSFGFASNMPQSRLVNNSQWQDNASWVRGRHTFKFGGEYDRQRSPNGFEPNVNGTFSYLGFDDMLANWVYSTNMTDGPFFDNYKEQDLAFYFQDDWRIKDNLTLNLGIRWEYTQQAINMLNQLTLARETGPTPFWRTNIPLDQRIVPAIPEDLNNWGPNVGFAYTPRIWESVFGKDKTVIRGGFRIAYDPAFYNVFLNTATAAPVLNRATLYVGMPAGSSYNGDEMRAGILPLMPTGCNTNACDPRRRTQTQVASDFHNPYAMQWSFGIQREITPKVVVEVRYVGDHTVGNFQSINGNPDVSWLATNFPSFVPSGITPCTTAGSPGVGRMNCTYWRVQTRNNGAWSIYHGLQSELRLRDFHGITGGLQYTWSRAIDNTSEIFSTFAGGNTVALSMNPFNPNVAERGVSGTSYPHVLTGWFIYQFPWYKSQQGFVGHLLGGWQTNGVYTYHSGQPFNLMSGWAGLSGQCDPGFASSFLGASTCRLILNDPAAPLDSVGICTNAVAGAPCNPMDYFQFLGLVGYVGASCTANCATQYHWIINDTYAALSSTFNSPYLGSGRNILRGQTVNNFDFSVYKDIKVTEGSRFQLQATVFNLFNRQFRGNPDPYVEDLPANNGDCTLANVCGGSFMNDFFNGSNRRSMTLGLKFIF